MQICELLTETSLSNEHKFVSPWNENERTHHKGYTVKNRKL